MRLRCGCFSHDAIIDPAQVVTELRRITRDEIKTNSWDDTSVTVGKDIADIMRDYLEAHTPLRFVIIL